MLWNDSQKHTYDKDNSSAIVIYIGKDVQIVDYSMETFHITNSFSGAATNII